MRRSHSYILFLGASLVFASCLQDPEAPKNLPDVPTIAVDESSVTRVSMLVNGSFGRKLTDITSYGVELSETLFESGGEVRTLTPQEVDANGFTLGISSLSPNKTYYLRAFISNGHSKMYSPVVTQKTPETSVASVTDVSLSADGTYMTATIEDDGGRTVEDVGFVWGSTNDRRSLRREKRYPATLDNNGKSFSLPISIIDPGLHYLLAYVEDDQSGTGFSLIPFVLNVKENHVGPGLTSTRCLTFISEGSTSISLTTDGNNTPILYYSNDGENWTRWDYDVLSFSKQTPLYLYGENPNGFNTPGSDGFSQFVTSGDFFSVSGDIMSLLSSEIEMKSIPSQFCFINLFRGCDNMITAPDLPATELSVSCYDGMFENCTNLAVAPELPSTKLSDWCYSAMFKNCENLLQAPALPATELAEFCYQAMFEGCSRLSRAPVLPALIMKTDCYSYMFSGCTSLTVAPELPATALANECYANMFFGCSNLVSTPTLHAAKLAKLCYSHMFLQCPKVSYVMCKK